MKSIFRTLVITSLFLFGLWLLTDYFSHYLYRDEGIINALEWRGYGAKVNWANHLFYPITVLYIIASGGLVLFKKWARTLFLFLTLFNVLVTPLYGLYVEAPYGGLITYLIALIDGSILTLAYLSNISNEFNKIA